MNQSIISHLYSVEDRAYVLEKLSILEKGAFNLKTPFEDQIHEQFSLSIAESLIKELQSSGITLKDGEAIHKALTKIQADMKSLPTITLRFAITPSDDMLRSIAIWFESVLGERNLIKYVTDPSLIGGVAIEHNGSYMDYSLKKLLKEKVEARNSKSETK